METLEQFFRFAGVAQLVVLFLVLIRDHRDTITGALVAAWALSGACYIAVVPTSLAFFRVPADIIDYLNQYRIAEATHRLTAPETRGLPVLTIAR